MFYFTISPISQYQGNFHLQLCVESIRTSSMYTYFSLWTIHGTTSSGVRSCVVIDYDVKGHHKNNPWVFDVFD